jgi:hypothetical protein
MKRKGMLYRHGLWLQHKRNYLLASTIAMGAFFTASFLWAYGRDRDVYFWLFVTAISFLGGFIWGLVMWQIMGKHNAARIRALQYERGYDRSDGETSSPRQTPF